MKLKHLAKILQENAAEVANLLDNPQVGWAMEEGGEKMSYFAFKLEESRRYDKIMRKKIAHLQSVIHKMKSQPEQISHI